MASWSILSESAELAVEISRCATQLGLQGAPTITPAPVEEAIRALARGEQVALGLLEPPSAAKLAALARASARVPIALLACPDSTHALARDLGIPTVREARSLATLMAVSHAPQPWAASTRALSSVDRARLRSLARGTTSQARLEPADDGSIALHFGEERVLLGEPRDVEEALSALAALPQSPRPGMPTVEGVDPQRVLDVILGPARPLSDPASKSALAAYDVPLPAEELCSSPSRAAAEASRIGFPVRVALASPDLRIWNHPDLAVDRVDTAARVRDVFRQLASLAKGRSKQARVLGVTVSATAEASALLRAELSSLGEGLVRADLGFADPHGRASSDETALVLPCSPQDLERSLSRLRGQELLLGTGSTARRERVEALGDALLRVAAFVHEWRVEVTSVRLDPLAVLVDGSVEIREACVEVSDAFERSLATG